MAGVKGRVPGIDCPHCKNRAVARSSEALTALTRNLYFRCYECGHAFIAQLSILHSVRPSDCPDPLIRLPIRLATTQAIVAAAGPPAANDSEPAEIVEAMRRLL